MEYKLTQAEFNPPKVEFPIELFKDNFSFQEHLWEQQKKVEDDCFKQVLRQFLQREPTIEDAKKCQRIIRDGVFDKYELSYDNIHLGTIMRIFEPDKYCVQFSPAIIKT